MFERGGREDFQGAGWDINQPGIKALIRAGLKPSTIQRSASDTMRFFRSDQGSKPLGALHNPRFLKQVGISILGSGSDLETNRNALVNGLLEQVEQSNANVAVHFNVQVEGVSSPTPDGRVQLTSKDGKQLGTFHLVIDSSGVGSRLRRHRFTSAADAIYTGVTFVQGFLPSPEESCDADLVRRLGEGTLVVAGPDPAGTGTQLVGLQRFGAAAEDKSTNFSLMHLAPEPSSVSDLLGFRGRSVTKEHLAKGRDWFAEQLSNSDWAAEYKQAANAITSTQILPIFMHPGKEETLAAALEDDLPLLQIGDSLHALPPWTGMSGNYALMDANDCADALLELVTTTTEHKPLLVATLRELEKAFLDRANESRSPALGRAELLTSTLPNMPFTEFTMIGFALANEKSTIAKHYLNMVGWLNKLEGYGMAKKKMDKTKTAEKAKHN